MILIKIYLKKKEVFCTFTLQDVILCYSSSSFYQFCPCHFYLPYTSIICSLSFIYFSFSCVAPSAATFIYTKKLAFLVFRFSKLLIYMFLLFFLHSLARIQSSRTCNSILCLTNSIRF